MFTELVAAGTSAYRRTRRTSSLGLVLASNGQPAPAPNHHAVCTTLDAAQRNYVTPLINHACSVAAQHLADTPLATTTQAAVEMVTNFQRDQVDPWIDRTLDASAALLRDHLLPLLPARVRTVRMETLPLLGDARRQHARLLAGADAEDPTPEEQALRRQLAVCVATFAFTSAAAVVAPPLMVLSLPGLFYINRWVLTQGYHCLVHERRFGIMALGSIVTTAMLVLGKFWMLSLWCLLFIPSEMLILKTRRRSRQRLVNSLGETPPFVWVQSNDSEMRLPFEQLQAGDVVVVGAGETIPIDGTIVSGTANIDQHMLTGEAQPAEKSRGDAVYAATIVLSGRLHIRVEQAGNTTVASQIGEILHRTADYHTRTELRGLHLAETMALPMLLLGAATLPLLGPTSAVAVMCCPVGYHVRLSGPISILNFLYIAAEHGILIKDGRALEALATVDTVVFDKTGTLTHEQPHVGGVHAAGGYDEHTVLQLAAAAETRQSHPIAHAILHEAHMRQLVIPTLDEATYVPGYGLRVGLRDGRTVRVGSTRFMDAEGMEIPTTLQAVQDVCQQHGHALVYVAVDDRLAGAIELHTTIRPEIAGVVTALHERGLHLVIMSGDQPHPTLNLARQLGIDHAFAEVLPQEKASLVAKLQREGRTVCFVGDGINDAIALKQAHVSVSLRGATTIATDTAQVVLMDKTLQQMPLLLDLAQQLHQNMQRNLLATIVPGVTNIASVGLLHTGVLAAAMISTVGMTSGVVNALLPLVRHTLQPPPALPDVPVTGEHPPMCHSFQPAWNVDESAWHVSAL